MIGAAVGGLALCVCVAFTLLLRKRQAAQKRAQIITVSNLSQVNLGCTSTSSGGGSRHSLSSSRKSSFMVSRKSLSGEPALPPEIFISFRFGEAHVEALALKRALEEKGKRVFISDVEGGGNIEEVCGYTLLDHKLSDS
jgi:hypothetical protein